MNVINESSLIRVLQHLKDPYRSFGVVSAYQEKEADKINFQNHLELRKEIRKMGYGFIEQKAGYSYIEDETSGIIEEKSYFIPCITLEETLYLGRLFNQETIIHKDNKIFALYFCDSGEIDLTFKNEENNFSLSTYDVENAYSQLIKANRNHRVKFSYIAELHIPTLSEVLHKQRLNEFARARWITIMEN